MSVLEKKIRYQVNKREPGQYQPVMLLAFKKALDK